MQQQYVQTTQNSDGTLSTTIPVQSASMDDIEPEFLKVGLVRNRAAEVPGQLPKDSYDAIMRSNPQHAQLVRSGRAVFRLLGHRQYVTPDNTSRVDMTDYGLNRVVRVRDPFRALDMQDPFIHITYWRGDPIVQQVMDILTHVLKRKFVQVASTEGVSSKRARRCVTELALISGITGDQAVAQCMALLERARPAISQSQPKAAGPSYWRDDIHVKPAGKTATRAQSIVGNAPSAAGRGTSEHEQMVREAMALWDAREQRMMEMTDKMIADMNRLVAETFRDMQEQTERILAANTKTAAGIRPRRTLYA